MVTLLVQGPLPLHAPTVTQRRIPGVTRYFPVALPLEGQLCVVVGSNDEAADKAFKLAEAGAVVRVVWPEHHSEVLGLASHPNVRICERPFTDAEVQDAKLVVLAEQDEALAQRLKDLGEQSRFWLCAIDQPRYCDWVNVGIVRLGPLTIAISSGGGAPALVRRLRRSLQNQLQGRFEEFATRFAERRHQLPRAERRRELTKLLEGFQIRVEVAYPEWFEEEPSDTEAP